jgi:uncharacterized protein YdeI (YjbR/CyaY-like superfamily)
MKRSANSKLGRYYPSSRQEWRSWLEENHSTSPGIWIIYYKKGANQPTVSYDEAVEEALSYGWIDSTVNALDEERYLQLFTPRKPQSTWSRLNKQRVEKLMKKGLMAPAGLEKIKIAKENGSWAILDDIESLIVPEDLKEALSNNSAAQSNFDSFSDSVKKQVLWWVTSARRPQTRSDRIEKVILSAENNEKPF